MSDDKRKPPEDNRSKRNKKGKEEDKTLKTLIALAGFAFGATSVIAWNNRKNIQEKASTAKERAIELKEKSVELTETVKTKIAELQEKKRTNSLEIIKSTSTSSDTNQVDIDKSEPEEGLTGESKKLDEHNKEDDE